MTAHTSVSIDDDGRRHFTSPNAKGPFATAIECGPMLVISGQGGFAADGSIPDGIAAQTHATLHNVRTILEDCGWELSDLVQVTCYLADIDEWAAMNSEYADFFADQPHVPTRTAIGVAGLPLGLRVEMTCVAARNSPTAR